MSKLFLQDIQNNFHCVGHWYLRGSEFYFSKEPSRNFKCVYAIVKQGVVVFLGKTTDLNQTVSFIKTPGPRQFTYQNLHNKLMEFLPKEETIELYVSKPENREWNGLPIYMIAGLRDGLHQNYKFEWNGGKRKQKSGK